MSIAALGMDRHRKVVCRDCRHGFVVPYANFEYAQEKIRDLDSLSGSLKQVLYPCSVRHKTEFCLAVECRELQ